MKRMIISAVLMLALCTASFARKLVAEGKTYTALGDYKIELADNAVIVKGDECKTYIISYENSPMEVTVAVCKDRKCKRYIVLSDKLSVQYVCNANYFGVEKLGKEYEKLGFKTSDDYSLDLFVHKIIGICISTLVPVGSPFSFLRSV